MDYNGLLELVKKRRSIRKFKPDPIPDEYIDKIIEVARWSPSGANSQPWEFIVIKKQELKDGISELLSENNKIVQKVEETREPAELKFKFGAQGYVLAPVFIILCGDPRTEDAYPLNSKLQQGNSHLISAMASCFLYMTLAATSLGLGSQWVSAIAHPYIQSLTKALLNVPRDLEFYDMMAVGYPGIEPRPRLVRERQEMIHYDYYDRAKFRSEQQVKDFILSLRR
jgi:nitroreductase